MVAVEKMVEMATLEWVDWFNNQRMMGSIGYILPVEAEQNYCKQQATEVFEYEALKPTNLLDTRGDSNRLRNE